MASKEKKISSAGQETGKNGYTSFAEWSKPALKKLYYPPDRKRVWEELSDHYLDRYEDCKAKGMSGEEARRTALAYMGDPEETGTLLAMVHKPWLGWLLRIARLASVLVIAGFLIAWVNNNFSTAPFARLDPKEMAETPYMASESEQRTVLARRNWTSSDRAELGPWEMQVAAVDFRITDVIYNSNESNSYHTEKTDCVIVVEYRGMPWNHMREDTVGRILKIEGSTGTQYVNRGSNLYRWVGDVPSFFQYTYRSGPNRFATWINMDRMPYREDWLDLIYCSGAGEEQRLRIRFGKWAVEPEAHLEPLTDANTAAAVLIEESQWQNIFLAEPETEWIRSWRQTDSEKAAPFAVLLADQRSFKDDVEASLKIIEQKNYDHLLPYEPRDCVHMSCVLIFPGEISQQPINRSILYEVLHVTDPDAEDPETELDWTVYSALPDRYSDAVLFLLEWDCRAEASCYTLRYEAPDGALYTLTLEPGEEVVP